LTTGVDDTAWLQNAAGAVDTGFKMPLVLLTPVAICAGFVDKWWQVAASVVATVVTGIEVNPRCKHRCS
jgi:hypothetical protein